MNERPLTRYLTSRPFLGTHHLCPFSRHLKLVINVLWWVLKGCLWKIQQPLAGKVFVAFYKVRLACLYSLESFGLIF